MILCHKLVSSIAIDPEKGEENVWNWTSGYDEVGWVEWWGGWGSTNDNVDADNAADSADVVNDDDDDDGDVDDDGDNESAVCCLLLSTCRCSWRIRHIWPYHQKNPP